MRQRNLTRLLDRGRRIVTLDTDLGLRQIIVFHAGAFCHRSMAGGAFELQRQMRAMRKLRAPRRDGEGQ